MPKKTKKSLSKKQMKKTKGGIAAQTVERGYKKHNPEPELGPTLMDWMPNRTSTTQMEK